MESEREKLGKLTINNLKIELRKIGAPLSGKKADLLQRLIDYKRNDNFARSEVFIPRANPMPSWPGSGFRSLTMEDRHNLSLIHI